MSEQQLQKKMILLLESKGFYVRKILNANKNGTPDLLCCDPVNGRFIGIEVKAKGKLKNVTKLQQYNLDEINECGGFAFACDDLEELKRILNLNLD